ncbi:MAG: hypothetical protein ACM31C_29705, partial [Acidobacteriota bacterium]
GALALLSFTAAKLWELRDRHFKQLTRSAYKMLGGVGGALAQHADVTLDAMLPEERALAREAFRHLVTTQHTRAVLPSKDLRQLLGGGEAADRVLEKLVAARLLVASENESGAETLEIVHEALLVAWPRLVEWQREDAEGARFREQLRAAAEQWHERGRAKGLLWRGDALADYVRWRARHPGPLTELEAAFADASVADAARGRRLRRLLVAGAFTALVAVVAVLVVANTRVTKQRRELRENLEKQYEAEGRQYVLADQPLLALAYLDKAAELGARGRAHDYLVAEAIRASDGELFEIRHDLPVRSARFSHDGALLVTAGYDHLARITDARTGKQLLELAHADAVFDAVFAPDDSTVLTASADHTAGLWDTHSGKRLQVWRHTGRVRCALYSHDGQRAFTAGGGDAIAIWDVRSGERVATLQGGSGFVDCALSADGELLAAGDGHGVVRVWNVRSTELVRELTGQQGPTETVRFIPGSDRVVAASLDGTAAVWSLGTGKLVYKVASDGPVSWAEASHDGRYLVTASDRTATLWDAASGRRVRVLAGHAAAVNTAMFSPDGKYVVTTSQDTTAWLWETDTARVVARWHGHRGGVASAAFDPRGERVATASDGGDAIVWSVRPQEPVVWLTGHRNLIFSAVFGAGGASVITAGFDGTVRVWDAATGREQKLIHDHDGWVTFAAMRPDGSEIAAGGDDHQVRIWNAATGTLRVALAMPASISQLAWSPDGSSIAASSEDGSVVCWDAASGAVRFQTREQYALRSLAFDPSGTRIVAAGDAAEIHVWSLDGTVVATYRDHDSDAHLSAEFSPSGDRLLITNGRQRALILERDPAAAPVRLQGHSGLVTYGGWSPDGQLAITASWDGTARVWDARTGAMLAIYSHPAKVLFAGFSPDGKRIVIAGSDGTAAIHVLPTVTPPEVENALACRVR